jgi:hypothetical protein
MVWVLGRSGLRIGEAIASHRRDGDLAAGLLRVVGSMSRSEGLRQVKGRQDDRIAELMKASRSGISIPGTQPTSPSASSPPTRISNLSSPWPRPIPMNSRGSETRYPAGFEPATSGL